MIALLKDAVKIYAFLCKAKIAVTTTDSSQIELQLYGFLFNDEGKRRTSYNCVVGGSEHPGCCCVSGKDC